MKPSTKALIKHHRNRATEIGPLRKYSQDPKLTRSNGGGVRRKALANEIREYRNKYGNKAVRNSLFRRINA